MSEIITEAENQAALEAISSVEAIKTAVLKALDHELRKHHVENEFEAGELETAKDCIKDAISDLFHEMLTDARDTAEDYDYQEGRKELKAEQGAWAHSRVGVYA